MFGPSPAVRSFYLKIFHLHGQGGSGRLWIRNGYNVVVYDRSMEMDGPCAVNRCMTDGKLENVDFFLIFLAPVGLLPAGDMYNFLIHVVSIIICQ